MIKNIFLHTVAKARPDCRQRTFSWALLAAWFAIFMAPAVFANEPVRNAAGDIADRLNHAQLAAAAAPAVHAALTAAGNEVGVLFLRGDGGDPQQLHADDQSTLVFIVRRDGQGRAYRNGREVEINAALKESAGQIATAQFGAPAAAEVPLSRLPAAAQSAVGQFNGGGIAPRIVFSHVTSRIDTGRVSDKRAAEILAVETAGQRDRADMVQLVRTAMQMFGLKSDACDNSADTRCDEPGVREAFAQIKREEALERTASQF